MTEIASLGLKVEGVNNVDKASGSLDRFSKSGDRADKSARGAAGGINQTGVESEKAGRSLTSMAGAARVAVGALAALGATAAIRRMVHTFADFESGMARVRAVSGATNAEFAALTETARRLGATTEFTGTQAASGLEFLARAGWSANESISALPAVLNLATAASMDLGAAADVASNIMSAFGIAASEASSVADVLAAASSRANTDVQQLGNAMAFVGPVAAALKIPMGDAAAAVGALSDAGIQGSAAGTGLRRVLSSLANPTGNAATALRSLGVELESVNPATNSLVDIVDRLSASGMSAADALTIFGDRGGPAILALVENNAKVRELSGGLRDVAGEAERMAGIMRDTLTGDMQAFSSAMQDLAITISSELGPSLRGIVQTATSFVRLLSDSMAEIKLVAGILGSLATAYLAVQTGAALATVAKWAYAKSSAAVVAGSVSAATAVMTLSGAFYTLAGAAGAFMVGFQIGKYLREEFEVVEKIGIALAGGLTRTFVTLGGIMDEIGANIQYALTSPLDFVRTKVLDFLGWLAGLGENVLGLIGFGGVFDDINAALESARPETEKNFNDMVQTIRDNTADKISEVDEIFGDMFANVGKGSKESVKELAAVEKKLVDIAKIEVPATTGATGEELERIASAINAIQRAADPAFAALQDYQTGMDTLAEGLLNNIIDDQQFVTLADHLLQVRDAALEAAEASAGITSGFDFASLENGLGTAVNEISKIQGAMQDGSKEARVLADAMTVLSVAQGAAAIANAMASGDPYTAVFRAMAVAAVLSQAGINSGVSGGASTAAADAQATQGTGGVLGDASAQSESISKGVDITADATSALVGINRAQLVALEAMRDAISGASTQIMRGQDFSSSEQQWGLFRNEMSGALGDSFDFITSMDGLTGWLDDLLGGSRAIINSGIEIAGGRINDLIDNTMVSAFQMVEEKKHFLDDKDTRRLSEALGDEVGGQFALVFGSMVDAVSASAEVLGIADSEIQRRIAEFRVAATEISLMDLDGEAQQAAISAVFSDIFDSLAVSVVDYVPEFRQAGESYAETLVRIATQVQVAEEAMTQLGSVLMDGLGGQDIVQMSDDLIKLSGGMESFITGFTGFVDKFATDEHKLSVATNAINSAMGQLGLEVPQSEDALWELMQTLTDPAQIAGLLRLQDSFETMFDMMGSVARELEGLHRSVNDQLLSMLSPAHAQLEQLNRAMGAQIAQAQELGIAEEDLTNMRRLHQLQLLEFAAGLEESIASLSDELFGTVDNGMDKTVSAVGDGMNKVRDLMISGIAQVNDWLQSSMLSSTSPLTPEQRLGEAQAQFDSQIAAARGGDASAISGLSGLADQLLSEASGFFGGSTQEFDAIWMQVREAMQGVAGMSIPDAVDPQRAIQTATESTAMSALQQITLASDMIGQMAALSRVTGENPADIADRLGVPIDRLMGIIGDTSGELTGTLDDQFNELVTGFDMTIDPLLTAQHTQIEATKKMNDDMNVRLDRLEDIMARGVVYQQRTANQTAAQNENTRQLIAVERRNAQSAPTQRVQ